MKNNKDLKKPFFANFLENQMSNEEKSSVQGGDIITLKTSDMYTTLKYPSDNEDGPGVPTSKIMDTVVTMKYPSDNDETGGPILSPDTDPTML
ncbi:microviridin/marinostatin family tricyclic proteinase inhibitor [Flavobacterium supellecticarium]|uniref:Microviridin/marinostatin family tricyclic proteinase inhibitor n=1 Tax=Flavobacterium supellecticarium TaxID=2565924 RepID=A0A4S4A2V8_9FLAO|nr:microviridin/marinostatin family tricyclic proteinase inhibitor [Flavobacterium supellecticarium]THF52747.1 microviridin/marinostatin family tricyclic proteinase inhibitor [Flavobacterium supellecticarium]